LAGLQLYAESFDGLGLQAVLRKLDALALQAAGAGAGAATGSAAAAAAAALGRKGGGSGVPALPASAPPHPCLPRGYVSPETGLRGGGGAKGGGFDACAQALRRVVFLNATAKGSDDKSESAFNNGGRRRRPRCPYRRKQGGCVFGTASLRPPLLSGSDDPQPPPLIGLDNFYYAAKALGLVSAPPPTSSSGSSKKASPNPTLGEFERAARSLCAKPWAEQLRAAGLPASAAGAAAAGKPLSGAASDQAAALAFLPRACAASTYVTLLLREGLGLPESTARLSFSNRVALAPPPRSGSSSLSSSFEATWTLGALLVETLELGGAVGVAGRDTSWAAVRDEGAASTSPVAVAGAAALFCLAIVALMVAASFMQVGLAWPPAGAQVSTTATALPPPSAGPPPAARPSHEYASVLGAAARLVDGAGSSSSSRLLPVSVPASDRRRSSLGGPSPDLPPLPPPRAETELVGLLSSSPAAAGLSAPPPGLGSTGPVQPLAPGLVRATASRRPPGLSPRASAGGGGGSSGGGGASGGGGTIFPSLSPKRGSSSTPGSFL
jgi:hypothetical protein